MAVKEGTTDIIAIPALFGANLRKLRQIREMTIEKASKASGLSVSFISLIEAGKRSVRLEDLRRLLGTYRYSVSWFLSSIQDLVPGKPFDPSAFVQPLSASILLDGNRGSDSYCLLLLRPLRSELDSGVYYLQMPPKYDMTNGFMTINAEVRGVVVRGRMLVSFSDDEFTASAGEEFTFDGKKAHIFRNYSNETTASYLFLNLAAI